MAVLQFCTQYIRCYSKYDTGSQLSFIHVYTCFLDFSLQLSIHFFNEQVERFQTVIIAVRTRSSSSSTALLRQLTTSLIDAQPRLTFRFFALLDRGIRWVIRARVRCQCVRACSCICDRRLCCCRLRSATSAYKRLATAVCK